MKRLAELLVFVSFALAAHIALFAEPSPSGAEAGGVGGEALVSLAGATPQLAAMVERWERPPDTAAQLDPMPTPAPVQSAQPDVPQVDLPVARTAQVQLPAVQPTAHSQPPQIDTAAPPPPSAVAPKTTSRPQVRPEHAAPTGRAQTTQAGRTAQRAAGTGGQRQAGQSARAQTSTVSAGQKAQLQAVWGAQIRSRIERRKRFPSGATGSGRVVVLITVSRTGRMLGYSIRTSSGSNLFDRSALQAVARATRLPAAPPELTAAQYSFALPIVFSR